MDHELSIWRSFRVALVLGVAALSFLTQAFSKTYEHSVIGHQTLSSTVTVLQPVYVTNNTGGSISVRLNDGSYGYNRAPGERWLFFNPQGFASGPVKPTGTPIEVPITHTPNSHTIQWQGFKSGTKVIPMPSDTIILSGGASGNASFTADPIEISIDPVGASIVYPEEEDDRQFEPGMILLDNQTGQPFDLQFGDEKIRVEPGLNVYPFYGEVGEDGLPKALPDGFEASVVPGPDGNKYWGAAMVPGTEGGPMQWQQLGHSVLPAPNSSSGPIIQTPGPNGTTNNYQLPKGMTPGNNLPLPSGVTPGTPGLPSGVTPSTGGVKLPEGVTPGTVGSLPNGVISGGSNHLPPGVSPGVKPSTGGTGSGDPPLLPGPGTNPDPVGPGGDNEPTTDGDWTPSVQEKKPGTQHDLAPKITGLRGAVAEKVAGFVPLAPNQTLPKIMSYTVNMPLPADMGTLTQTLNFAQTPFPQIRAVILILFNCMVAVSFVRRITI